MNTPIYLYISDETLMVAKPTKLISAKCEPPVTEKMLQLAAERLIEAWRDSVHGWGKDK